MRRTINGPSVNPACVYLDKASTGGNLLPSIFSRKDATYQPIMELTLSLFPDKADYFGGAIAQGSTTNATTSERRAVGLHERRRLNLRFKTIASDRSVSGDNSSDLVTNRY